MNSTFRKPCQRKPTGCAFQVTEQLPEFPTAVPWTPCVTPLQGWLALAGGTAAEILSWWRETPVWCYSHQQLLGPHCCTLLQKVGLSSIVHHVSNCFVVLGIGKTILVQARGKLFQKLALGVKKPYHSTSFLSNKKNTLMHWNYLGGIIHVIYIHNFSIFMKKYRQHFWHFNLVPTKMQLTAFRL